MSLCILITVKPCISSIPREIVYHCDEVAYIIKQTKIHANKKAPSIIEKIKEFIGKLLLNLRAIYTNLEPDSNAGRAVREMTDVAKQLHSMFTDMALDAAQNKQAAKGEMLESDGGVKYSIRKEFSKEIQEWYNSGRADNEVFVLGETSDIYMRGEKINDIIKKHPEVGLSEIKKIPKILENPIIILSSKKIK